MANEITLTSKLKIKNGSYESSVTATALNFDQTAIGGVHTVQAIGTSYEVIDIADISVEGFAMFRNLDDTNYIQIGVDGGASLTPIMRLNAGEVAGPFRIDTGATLYAQADTASIDLEVIIAEA